MPTIDSINTTSPTTSSSPSSSLEVNQNQFIELFVAQLNNQDPLAPLDTNQMLTQLSQISSVESLNSIDDRIEGLTSSLQQSQMFEAADLLGKEVNIDTNRVDLTERSTITGQAQLPIVANDVLIRAYDVNGELAASKTLGSSNSGNISFSLEGRKYRSVYDYRYRY